MHRILELRMIPQIGRTRLDASLVEHVSNTSKISSTGVYLLSVTPPRHYTG